MSAEDALIETTRNMHPVADDLGWSDGDSHIYIPETPRSDGYEYGDEYSSA